MHEAETCKLGNLDPVYTVPDSRSHDNDLREFKVIFTPTTFTMISC